VDGDTDGSIGGGSVRGSQLSNSGEHGVSRRDDVVDKNGRQRSSTRSSDVRIAAAA
jgi:hypothetical protein